MEMTSVNHEDEVPCLEHSVCSWTPAILWPQNRAWEQHLYIDPSPITAKWSVGDACPTWNHSDSPPQEIRFGSKDAGYPYWWLELKSWDLAQCMFILCPRQRNLNASAEGKRGMSWPGEWNTPRKTIPGQTQLKAPVLSSQGQIHSDVVIAWTIRFCHYQYPYLYPPSIFFLINLI